MVGCRLNDFGASWSSACFSPRHFWDWCSVEHTQGDPVHRQISMALTSCRTAVTLFVGYCGLKASPHCPEEGKAHMLLPQAFALAISSPETSLTFRTSALNLEELEDADTGKERYSDAGKERTAWCPAALISVTDSHPPEGDLSNLCFLPVYSVQVYVMHDLLMGFLKVHRVFG